MKFNQIIRLDEVKGKGSFDYSYWFWAKKGSSFGLGYARQPIELDIQKKGSEAMDALDNIKNVMKTLEADKENIEVVEKKIKANTKRLTGIIDLLSAPIIINWLNRDPTVVIAIPRSKPGDVTDLDGRNIDVVKIFRDPSTQEFITDVIDWDKVKINDKDGDTLNTILAKFISSIFAPGVSKKQVRTYARGAGLEEIMGSLSFKDDKKGVEVAPFKKSDYNLFPKETRGSKKMVEYLRKLIDENFAKVLKNAREAF
jgi:hypothetical protein